MRVDYAITTNEFRFFKENVFMCSCLADRSNAEIGGSGFYFFGGMLAINGQFKNRGVLWTLPATLMTISKCSLDAN